MPVEAVTFDFWNTLVYEERGHLRGRRLDAWAGILEEAGFACERERLDAVFDSSWTAYVERWKANRQFQAVDAAERILEELGFDVSPEVREALLDAFTRAGIDACLRILKGRGVRLGIVCDVGMTASSVLRDHLARLALVELLDHWSFSDEVGVYKPAPEIFGHALRGLGAVAGRTAHVGDLRRTDVAGAKAMGMTSVRYTGVFDDDTAAEPEADIVVAAHADLPAALGF